MNILICAVGGQGALLSSKVIGQLAQNIGLDVKTSEVHGMSQRGGSVVTYVKYGEMVHSPVIEKGTADVIMAFEELESVRYIDYLREGGTVIVNKQRINPMPVIIGVAEYPDNIIDSLKDLPIELYDIDAVEMAEEIGDSRVTNTILLGVLANITGINKDEWLRAIREMVPEKALNINFKAFEMGYNLKEALVGVK